MKLRGQEPKRYLDRRFLTVGGEVIADNRAAATGGLILGAVGSGKTSGVMSAIIRSIASQDMPCVIACPKDDDLARWMKVAADFGKRCIVVDPTAKARINFFEAVSAIDADPASLSQMATGAFDSFTQVAGRNQSQNWGAEGKFWQESYSRCMRTVLHLHYLAGVIPTPTSILKAVLDLPNAEQLRGDQWKTGYLSSMMFAAFLNCKQNGWMADYDNIKAYITGEMVALDPRTKSPIVSTVSGVCDNLVRGKAAEILGSDSTFTMQQVIDERLWVLINYPAATWLETGRFITVGITYLAKLAGRRREVKENTPLFPIVLDEAQLYVTEDDFQHTAISRSSRCPLFLATQGIEQFHALFGKDSPKADVLTHNLGVKFVCLPSFTTAKWVSDQIGQAPKRMHSGNVSTGKAYQNPLDFMGFAQEMPQVSSGWSQQMLPILRPEEMLGFRTFGGEIDCLVYRPGHVFENGRNFTIKGFKQT